MTLAGSTTSHGPSSRQPIATHTVIHHHHHEGGDPCNTRQRTCVSTDEHVRVCRWGGSRGIHHRHRSSSNHPIRAPSRDHSDQSVCHIRFHSIPFHYNGDGNPTIREKGERAKWFAKSESCGYEFYHRHKANIFFKFHIIIIIIIIIIIVIMITYYY